MCETAPVEQADLRPLLNKREAAARLSISLRKLSDMISANAVPHLRIGHSIRFRPEALDEWVNELESGGCADG